MSDLVYAACSSADLTATDMFAVLQAEGTDVFVGGAEKEQRMCGTVRRELGSVWMRVERRTSVTVVDDQDADTNMWVVDVVTNEERVIGGVDAVRSYPVTAESNHPTADVPQIPVCAESGKPDRGRSSSHPTPDALSATHSISETEGTRAHLQ